MQLRTIVIIKQSVMAVRKTTKYFREMLATTQNTSMLNVILTEVVLKYGADKTLRIGGAECNWNHWVKGFTISNRGELLVIVYWQGDDTDGDDYVPFNEVYNRGKSVIRAESYWDGYRTRYTHGDINVEKYEVEQLIKLLVEWLSPSAIKARKIRAELREVEKAIDSKLGNEYYSKYASKIYSCNEEYFNGRNAVREWVVAQGENLLKMTLDEVFAMMDKVFHANYKNDRFFGKTDMWSGRTKPYIISF